MAGWMDSKKQTNKKKLFIDTQNIYIDESACYMKVNYLLTNKELLWLGYKGLMRWHSSKQGQCGWIDMIF